MDCSEEKEGCVDEVMLSRDVAVLRCRIQQKMEGMHRFRAGLGMC